MIISFSIKNWMSFRDETSLSMIASRERQHGKRVARIAKYKTKLLPIAAIYGGNAAGKTNFFQALNFVKRFVVMSTRTPDSPIPIKPYRLDKVTLHEPSFFKLELLINEIIYEFSFSASEKTIFQEKLIRITSTSEKTLYDRQGDKIEIGDISDNKDFLAHVAKGTRNNQLYLTSASLQNVDIFRPVYDWFDKKLELIAPDTRFQSFEHFINEDGPLYSTMKKMLLQLDTGIDNLGGEEIPFNNLLFPEELKASLREELKEGQSAKLNPMSIIITKKGGELIAKKLVTYHKRSDGKEVKFELHEESDGTQRVINILPVFLDLSSVNSSKVYVIDEVERSLHTLLIKSLLEYYLENNHSESRTQLLITTHDLLLMDQTLFRRDEMWVTERAEEGNSRLISFHDYKDVRYDKDVRKSYLLGRLGGIPNLRLPGRNIKNKE